MNKDYNEEILNQVRTAMKDSKKETKLFLNNLYGKLASTPESSFKFAIPKDDAVHFVTIQKYDKTPGYIACGSAITSYARNFTIIYADTDSIHCDLEADELVGVPVHPTEELQNRGL